MKTYFGTFHIPGKTEPFSSTVLVFEKNLSIGYRDADGINVMVNWPLPGLESSFEWGAQRTRVRSATHPGMELFIEGKDADSYIKELQAEREKAWYKKSSGKEWIRNTMLLLGIAGLLFLLYLLIVPWLSSRLASNVSKNTEQQLGDAVYDAMGLAGREDTAASFLLNEFFATMDVPTEYKIRITVINENTVNAFALPGGRIVVYSALLDEVDSYPELAALLSHEFTHVDNKHATRSIFRRLGSKVFLGLLFGRLGTVTSVLVDHADNIKSLKYSRKLEKEADMDGLSILMQREIDPAGFVALFSHLKNAAPANHLPEFLASHPDIDKRIAYIRKNAEGAIIKENSRLKTIFEKLNKTNTP